MIFPPAFLDSSSWNTNQQLQPQAHHPSSIGSLAVGGEGNNHHELLQAGAITPGALPEGGGGGAASAAPAKPMSMADRARLARIPQPEPGLKCPRCESTNTKFCYFNNYSLSQPRHFCRACRRYWTRGGALRNVPVGGGYRRHAKRAKPKATPSTSSATTASASASTMSSTSTVASSSAFPAMLSNHAPILPPLHRIADFDAMSLGSSLFGTAKPFMDTTADTYPIGGGGSMGMEQWRAQQIQSFPFLHALDQIPPAPAMAMPGMFHLGLDGGRGEDGGELHVMPMKTEGYPRGVYGDASGYTPYSSTTGNLL